LEEGSGKGCVGGGKAERWRRGGKRGGLDWKREVGRGVWEVGKGRRPHREKRPQFLPFFKFLGSEKTVDNKNQ